MSYKRPAVSVALSLTPVSRTSLSFGTIEDLAIDWIWNNRDWLFSGAGIAIISLVWRYRPWKRVATPVSIAAPVPISTSTSLAAAVHPFAPTPVVRIDPITADEIRSELDTVAPLQREDAAKQFHGIWVRWAGTLKDLARKGSAVEVVLLVTTKGILPLCYFTVELDDYPSLKIMKPGTSLVVRGRIAKVAMLDVVLENAQIE